MLKDESEEPKTLSIYLLRPSRGCILQHLTLLLVSVSLSLMEDVSTDSRETCLVSLNKKDR